MADDLSTKASTSAPVLDGVLERRLWQPTAWAANPSEGGETSTSKLAVLVPWSPPRVIGVTGNSVHQARKIQKLKPVLIHGSQRSGPT
jgi:hypothetical protein